MLVLFDARCSPRPSVRGEETAQHTLAGELGECHLSCRAGVLKGDREEGFSLIADIFGNCRSRSASAQTGGNRTATTERRLRRRIDHQQMNVIVLPALSWSGAEVAPDHWR
jgi:hypothetical protein